MNKKIFYFLSLLLMISFSTGVFVEIITTDSASLSQEAPNFFFSLWESIKNDMFTIFLVGLLSATVILMPCVSIFILAKVFSLGFSAAYLLSAHERGFGILLAVLLPRCILRLPAYVALILIALQTAKQIKSKRKLILPIKDYLFCLFAFFISSLIEVSLLQLILLP